VSSCRDLRDEECRKFVSAVNGKLEEIERITGNRDPSRNVTSAEMRRLAELYDGLAKKTSAGELSTKILDKLRSEYNLMVLEAAKDARAVADALDAKDLEAAMKAHERFGEVVSKEDTLVGQVNALCQQK
jgi:DNA-binding transcriptional regulator YbjK